MDAHTGSTARGAGDNICSQEELEDLWSNSVASANDDKSLDYVKLEHRIYRDQFTGVQREIWRPGDGDGDQGTDYYERTGPALQLEKRWRFFQSDIGPMDIRNQPPRFVILDDRAAHEVLKSDIQKSKMVQNWPHDFGGSGKIRARRPHRGRPAIKDQNAEGDAKYHGTTTGGKKDNYFFTGEKDYQPIVYSRPLPKQEKKQNPLKRKVDHMADNPRAHGHNQYTPKDLLVKHGAPSFSKKEQQVRTPRINTFLRRNPSPPVARERSLYGGIPESTRASVLHESEMRKATGVAALAEPSIRYLNGLYPTSDVNSLDQSCGWPDSVEDYRSMSHAQRTALEQTLAMRVVGNIQSQDDVTRFASKLAQAQIKVAEQTRIIQRLEKELARARSDSN